MMVQAIDGRELFTLHADGVSVCGTYHPPLYPPLSRTQNGSAKTASASAANSVGLVFVNAFSAPRAYMGDAAVYWADSFAARGYPCFRLDLRGLGDSDGPTPPELLSFITGGGYSSSASASAGELVERFHLSGVIFVGHCAGAVTSVFSAALGRDCKGVILMDPYFHAIAGVRSRLRMKFTNWARQRRIAAPLSLLYARLRAVQRTLSSSKLPANANLPLLARWKLLTARGLPILTLMSPDWGIPSEHEKAEQFDYTGHIRALAGPDSALTIHRVPGTDHSFTNHAGRSAFVHHVEEWLDQYFPADTAQDRFR